MHQVQRTLAHILGLTTTLAKTEQENEIGQSAAQMLQLLLDKSTFAKQHSMEVRRVSI